MMYIPLILFIAIIAHMYFKPKQWFQVNRNSFGEIESFGINIVLIILSIIIVFGSLYLVSNLNQE